MSQFRQITLSGFLACMLALNGCGGTSKSSGSDSNGGDVAVVSGTVSISQSDLAQISFDANGSSIQSAVARAMSDDNMAGISSLQGLTTQSTLTSGTVQAFAIEDDGDLVAVGDPVPIDENGRYQFTNLVEGRPYILRVLQTGHDYQGNENSLSQYSVIIPDASTPTQNPISSKTSAATDFFVKEILSAVNGNTFQVDDVEALVDTFLSVMTDKIVNDGTRLPSMIVDTDTLADNFEDELNNKTDFDELREEVSSNQNMNRIALKTKLTARASKSVEDMSLEEAKTLVKDVFKLANSQDKRSEDSDDSLPDFFATSFAEGLLAGKTISIAEFAQAFHNAVDPDILSGALKNTLLTKTYLETHMVNVINNQEVGLKVLYDSYDRNEESEFPPAFLVVFPKDQASRWNVPHVTADQRMNILQTLVVMGLTGLMGESSIPGVNHPIMNHPDLQDNQRQALENEMQNGGPFDPIAMCSELGLIPTVGTDEVFIQDVRMTPEKTYQQVGQQNWQQVDNLTAEVELYNKTGRDISSVRLIYPTQEGTNSKLLSHIEGNSWRIAPWGENNQQPDPDKYITDFRSGTATLRVTMEDNSTVDKQVEIHKFTVGEVNWIYPSGMDSMHPEDYEMARMDLNGQNGLSPVLSWSIADRDTLDSNYDLSYDLEVRLGVTPLDMQDNFNAPSHPGDVIGGTLFDNSQNEWDRTDQNYASKLVWASWREGRRIRSTSFKLPVELPRTVSSVQQNYVSFYEVNVTPVIVDKSTGRVVSRGFPTATRFTIGTSAPWSISLHGSISFPTREQLERMLPKDINRNVLPGTFKVGLFKTGEPDQDSNEWKNMFDSQTAQAFAPVNNGDAPMIVTLGSISDIYGSDSGVVNVDYTLPTFGRADQVLARRKGYSIMVWYDLASKPNGDMNWSQNNTAESGKLDFGGATSPLHPLEWHVHAPANFRLENNGVYMNKPVDRYRNENINLVFNTSAQTFNFDLFQRPQPPQ